MSGDRDRTAILAVSDQEVSAAARGDVKAYYAILTDDAVLMPPNSDARSGTDLRTWLRQFLENVAVEWLSFEHGDVAVEGSLGCHCYEYAWRIKLRGGGAPDCADLAGRCLAPGVVHRTRDSPTNRANPPTRDAVSTCFADSYGPRAEVPGRSATVAPCPGPPPG